MCDNYWNKFSTNVLRERLHKYLDEIREIQRTHLCRKCYLVLGGDNVSGLIHANLRLQNNENVIQQLKIASEYIGNFVNELVQMETFEDLAMCDVARFLYEELKMFEGLETVYANIDLKLADLQEKANRREEVINYIKESYVSASNKHQPYILTI